MWKINSLYLYYLLELERTLSLEIRIWSCSVHFHSADNYTYHIFSKAVDKRDLVPFY